MCRAALQSAGLCRIKSHAVDVLIGISTIISPRWAASRTFRSQPLTLRRKRSRRGKLRADGMGGLRSKPSILSCRGAIPLALVCSAKLRMNSISRSLLWTDCERLQSQDDHRIPVISSWAYMGCEMLTGFPFLISDRTKRAEYRLCSLGAAKKWTRCANRDPPRYFLDVSLPVI